MPGLKPSTYNRRRRLPLHFGCPTLVVGESKNNEAKFSHAEAPEKERRHSNGTPEKLIASNPSFIVPRAKSGTVHLAHIPGIHPNLGPNHSNCCHGETSSSKPLCPHSMNCPDSFSSPNSRALHKSNAKHRRTRSLTALTTCPVAAATSPESESRSHHHDGHAPDSKPCSLQLRLIAIRRAVSLAASHIGGIQNFTGQFHEFDANRDGSIDHDEFRNLCQHLMPGLNKNEVEFLIQSIDPNGRGYIIDLHFFKFIDEELHLRSAVLHRIGARNQPKSLRATRGLLKSNPLEVSANATAGVSSIGNQYVLTLSRLSQPTSFFVSPFVVRFPQISTLCVRCREWSASQETLDAEPEDEKATVQHMGALS